MNDTITSESAAFSTREVHLASYALYNQQWGIEENDEFFPDAIPFYKDKEFMPGKKSCAGYVIYKEGKILVSYRGTAELVEWTDNLSARATSMNLEGGEKVNVHAGFKHEYDLSKKNMETAIKAMKERVKDEYAIENPDDIPITFAGHSM